MPEIFDSNKGEVLNEEAECVTWQQVEEFVEKVAQYVSIVEPLVGKHEFVYGVPRGGLVLATMISHKLGIPLKTDLTSYYSDLPRHLLVDDISDTGRTLNAIKTKSATIVTMYMCKDSSCGAHFSVHTKTNKWIKFPWEVDNNG